MQATTHRSTRPLALVTGGSRGIGLAIARDLATTHDVLVGGTTPEGVARVVEDLPGARPFVADLTDDGAVAQAVRGIEALDVLVHSAGMVEGGHIAETPAAQWRQVLELNVVAVAELTRLLLPALRAARGQIITINSGSGYRANPGSAVYSASKFALRALTDALREEERGTVRVTSIHPGRVDTDMQVALQRRAGNQNYDGTRYVRPDSVAATVRLAVDASPEAMIEELQIRPVRQG
ncbi:MAG: SDR family oxidoreductase [Bowdeniella nasicola]|nr:SDR family oxidoreductase [Bowdeniella nasicola]